MKPYSEDLRVKVLAAGTRLRIDYHEHRCQWTALSCYCFLKRRHPWWGRGHHRRFTFSSSVRRRYAPAGSLQQGHGLLSPGYLRPKMPGPESWVAMEV